MKDELQDEHTAPRAAINSNEVGGGRDGPKREGETPREGGREGREVGREGGEGSAAIGPESSAKVGGVWVS